MEYSPIAALNRTYALSKVCGNLVAIREAEKLQLTDNPYYHALLGELYKSVDQNKSLECFKKSHSLAKTATDKNSIQKKTDELLR